MTNWHKESYITIRYANETRLAKVIKYYDQYSVVVEFLDDGETRQYKILVLEQRSNLATPEELVRWKMFGKQ